MVDEQQLENRIESLPDRITNRIEELSLVAALWHVRQEKPDELPDALRTDRLASQIRRGIERAIVEAE